MHFTDRVAWHQAGLRLHLEPARDPTDYSGSNAQTALSLDIYNLNPSVQMTHVFTYAELRRVALWLLWKSIVGVKQP